MIQQALNGMITLLLAKFMLNDVPHAAGLSNQASKLSLPAGYIFLGERRLGPFKTSTEADSAIKRLDYNDKEVYEGLLRKHGPAYLMLAFKPANHYVLYHATPLSKVKSILTQGLQPNAEPYFTKQHELISYGIYLGDTWDTVEGFLLEKKPDEEPAELLKVNIPWNWTLWADPEIVEMGSFLAEEIGFYISKDPIPPDWIRVAPESIKRKAEKHWKLITGEGDRPIGFPPGESYKDTSFIAFLWETAKHRVISEEDSGQMWEDWKKEHGG